MYSSKKLKSGFVRKRYFSPLHTIFSQLNSSHYVGGNLFCVLIILHIRCHWRDNGWKKLQWSWHDFMRIQFKKVFCWQSRTSEERKLKEIFFFISLSSAEDSKENVDYWDICNLVKAFDYKGSCADFCSEKNCFDVKGWGHHWEKGNVIKKYKSIQVKKYTSTEMQIYYNLITQIYKHDDLKNCFDVKGWGHHWEKGGGKMC